jgi:tetratricopeptide (TPR) repeat protein
MDSVLVNIVRRVPKFRGTLVFCSLITVWLFGVGLAWSAAPVEKTEIGRVRALAVKLERKSTAVVFLSEMAAEWAGLNPSRAKALLDEAYQIAGSLEDSKARMTAVRLRTNSVWWDPDSKSQARDWADRIADITRPVGPYLAMADAWREIDLSQVAPMALKAAGAARSSPSPRQRDMGMRAAAVMLADVDPQQAEFLGLAIQTPEIRAWAFSSMAHLIMQTDKEVATAWYGRAVEAGLVISNALERLRVLSGLACEWHGLDAGFSEKLFRDGVRLADGLESPVERAQAFSILGIYWGQVDSRKAFELVQMIPVEYTEARLAVYLAAADKASGEQDFQRLIRAAHREAGGLTPVFEQEKALARIACLLAGKNLDAALEIYDELRPGNRWLRDEVAGTVVKAAANWNMELAVELTEQVENPELKASLTAALTAELTTADPDRALSVLGNAVKAVEEEQIERCAPDVIEVLAILDPATAMTLVNETWPIDRQVDVWINIALAFERKGQSGNAKKIWTKALALADANKNFHGLKAAEMYRAIARAMTDARSERADDVYEMARHAVAGWMKGAEKHN